MKAPRFSPQRELIKDIVCTQAGHLNVEEVYKRAKKSLPKISLATIYRNLKQLEDLKEISTTQAQDQTLYEAYTEPHHHFVCRSCNSVQNLDSHSVKTCIGCLSGKTPLQIESVFSTIYGLCVKCK